MELWSRIRAAFQAIETVESETNRAAALIVRLDQAILTKAFSGELLSSRRPVFSC